MNVMQKMVRDYFLLAKKTIGEFPNTLNRESQSALIEKFSEETVKALNENDLVTSLTNMTNLLYTIFESAVAFGVDIQKLFDEVHRAKMASKGDYGESRFFSPDNPMSNRSSVPDIVGILDDMVNACQFCRGKKRLFEADGSKVECPCFDGRSSPREGSCKSCGRKYRAFPSVRCKSKDFHEFQRPPIGI